jgi:predicted RNA-binding protein with PUA-like domain
MVDEAADQMLPEHSLEMVDRGKRRMTNGSPTAPKEASSSVATGTSLTSTLHLEPSTRFMPWLVKSEPAAYSWQDFLRDGKTAWTGVRNFQSRNNLRAMKKGDEVLFYHSVTDKEVVGLAKVIRTAYADPTAEEGDWSAVDLAPVRALAHAVSLDQIKAMPALKDIALLRNSRLSVQPLTDAEFNLILKISAKQ